MDRIGAWIAIVLIIGGFIVTVWLVLGDDVRAECRADHPGPTPASCFSDPPPWQTEGDAPERGTP